MNRIINITPKKAKIPQPQILKDYNNIMSNVSPTVSYEQYISNYFKYIPYAEYMSYWLEYSINNPTIAFNEYVYNTIYTFYIGQLFESTIKSYYKDSNLLVHTSKEEAEIIDHKCKIDVELYTDTEVIGLQCKSKSFLNCNDNIKQYQTSNIINNYFNIYEDGYKVNAYIVVYDDNYNPMTYNNSHLIELSDVLSIHSKDLKHSTFNNLFTEINSLLS